MKTVLKNYSFNTSTKAITLTDVTTVRLDRLALITDVTTNKILYNFADSTVSTATVATNVVTLSALQGGEANGDKLRIDYDTEATDTAFLNDIAITELSDGTNTANVIAGDSGQNAVKTGYGTKTINFSATATGIMTGFPVDVSGYSWVEVFYTAIGSGVGIAGEFSLNGTNFVNPSSWIVTNSVAVTTNTLALSTTLIYATPVWGSTFQLRISAITSGTVSGTVILHSAPRVFQANGVAAAQNGTWTVGSNSATGSAVPANAFYMGISNGTNLTAPVTMSAISDASAGGSTMATGSYTFNGTTYDRQRSATAASNTTGTGLLGVGNLMFDGTNWQVMRTTVGDGSGAGLFLDTAAFQFNGTNYDRPRNNTTGAVIAAGATTTQTSATQTTYNASKLAVVINISAFTSGTLTFTVNGITSSGYTYLIGASTALGATGVTALRIFPGATAAANLTFNDMVPRSYQVVVSGTFVATYGVDYELSV